MAETKLSAHTWYLELVASMEQIIGAALSSIVGIVIPLLNLMLFPAISPAMQGIMGAAGLTGIALGSAIIGPLIDRQGYLSWFRACAVIIIAGGAIAMLAARPWVITAGLFVAGLGVGGGYSLDSAYISEIMPGRWQGFMVGVAKASCSLGFLLPPLVTIPLLALFPDPRVWRWIMAILSGLGVVTLIMRIHWAESPQWLLSKGRRADALKSARFFYGPDATLPATATAQTKPVVTAAKQSGGNLRRIIYSGIPWACEGVGVYGIGVFVPVLIMALGLTPHPAGTISAVTSSVTSTAVVNACILPGFVLGLVLVKRVSHFTLLWTGFVGSAVGIGLILWAYVAHLPVSVYIAGFVIFEIALNAGPHLITFIIPTYIFPPDERGAGTGIANFLGKVGAIAGVFLMPLLLHHGGMALVLSFTGAVMLAGAVIAALSRPNGRI